MEYQLKSDGRPLGHWWRVWDRRLGEVTPPITAAVSARAAPATSGRQLLVGLVASTRNPTQALLEKVKNDIERMYRIARQRKLEVQG